MLPARTRRFRFLTVAGAGIGTFALGLFLLESGFGGNASSVSSTVAALLAALAAATTAFAFFAGIDESARFVFAETHFDRLTGLPNRFATGKQIADAARRTAETGSPVYMIDLDIDRFKSINDAIGYAAGDQLIRAFAERLKAGLPRGAELGRIGAGEFVILCPDRPDIAIGKLADRLLADLRQPYPLASHLQTVSVSAGIVALPKDGTEPALVLRRSSLALQHARASAIGGWSVFRPEFGRAADRRQWIEAALEGAIERNEFVLYYQPQYDLGSCRIVGYEALLRWRHPTDGLISPAEFVPVAEETGLIVPLGKWALNRACLDAHALPDACPVAVNISAIQFQSADILSMVRDALFRSGLSPHRLELEVTESAMTQDRARASAILSELAGMGISVAVDDFGTGYSNLSSLMDLPFRKIKIDQSFVRRLEADGSAGAVVSTIVGLARALDVRVIAEGVETPAQAMLLRAAGCETVQGFLYGRPLPIGAEPPRLLATA